VDEVCLVSFLAENAQMGTLSSVSVYVEVLILYENCYSFCSVFDLLETPCVSIVHIVSVRCV